MMDLASAFLEGTVRTATPLALAALGEVVVERGGVVNIGLEGAIIAGALGGVAGATAWGPAAGYAVGMLAGSAVAMVLAALAVGLRTDQIITGTAVTAGALGLTAVLYRVMFGTSGVALTVPTTAPIGIPGLEAIPVVGAALFRQTPATYAVFGLVPLLWWMLFRTRAGLALRAVGESPDAALAAGISPRRVQAAGLLAGGALGGAAGATLVLAQVGTFAEGMSAGRGFIALAIVALGRWHPVGALLASLLFGAASALQYLFQSTDTRVPYQIFLALPYALTLLVLATGTGRRRAPAALARRDVDVE